jgi:arabinoxylan arabinofuranohydrolase
MNPYELQQAETMATCAGISYEDFTNIKKNGRVSNLGNDASENMQVKTAEGSWIQLRKVDFGTNGASAFTLRAKGEGTIEVRIGRRGAKASATVDISSSDMSDYTIDVDASKFNGQKNIFLFIASGTDIYLDAWQFTESQPDAIKTATSSKLVKHQSYDLQGRRLSDTSQHRGIVIEQYIDENGMKHSRKRF